MPVMLLKIFMYLKTLNMISQIIFCNHAEQILSMILCLRVQLDKKGPGGGERVLHIEIISHIRPQQTNILSNMQSMI